MRRRVSPKAAKRMLKRMGMSLEKLEGVKEAIFRMDDREMIIKNPEVSVMKLHGQEIYQVMGEASERRLEGTSREIPEEDIQLVAQQTGSSLEEAKAALADSDGDLARAILMLTQRRS